MNLPVLIDAPQLAGIDLGVGSHPDGDGYELGFDEAAALLAGERHRTTSVQGVDRTLLQLGGAVSDALDYAPRQELKSLVAHVLGTRGDGLGYRRLAFALRWMVTELAPELLGRLGHWDRADELAAYYSALPLEPSISAWAGPLGAVEHARMTVRVRLSAPRIDTVPADKQEYQDVEAMLGRIIAALTDFTDPAQFHHADSFAEHIANELAHVFHVHLDYPFFKIDRMLIRFLRDLTFTGRSYV